MVDVPDMWRVELWHPMVVHFPIALLSVGALFWLAGQWAGERGRWAFLRPAARLTLAFGVASAWVAVFTGDQANSAVARQLCDPTVAETHEDLAWWVALLFSGAWAIDMAAPRLSARAAKKAAALAVGASLIVATALLFVVGHHGAKLVYQQAAAVHRPDAMCTGFE